MKEVIYQNWSGDDYYFRDQEMKERKFEYLISKTLLEFLPSDCKREFMDFVREIQYEYCEVEKETTHKFKNENAKFTIELLERIFEIVHDPIYSC